MNTVVYLVPTYDTINKICITNISDILGVFLWFHNIIMFSKALKLFSWISIADNKRYFQKK